MAVNSKIGVVIPYVNGESYVIQLLKTLEAKRPIFPVIIDNTGSKNEQEPYPWEREMWNGELIKNSQNQGVAGAWNQGIEACIFRHDIERVLVLNHDVLLHKDAIDNMATAINTHDFPIVTATDVAGQCVKPIDVFNLRVPHVGYFTDEPCFSCFMISREGYNDIGQFDTKLWPAYFEDNDYHYRAKLKKRRLVKMNTAMFYHYGSRSIRDNPVMGNIINKYYLQNEAYYIEKWGGKPGREKYKAPFNERRGL